MNVENVSPETTNEYESRQNLNVPKHGKVPKWLEDMSNNVERSHSLSTDEGFTKLLNGPSAFDKKSGLPSAKYGRRASILSTLRFKSMDKQEYSVPKLDERNFHEIMQYQSSFTQMYNESQERLSKSFAKAPLSLDSELSTYSPSMFDGEGRRSRIDALETSLNNTLISTFKNFTLSESDPSDLFELEPELNSLPLFENCDSILNNLLHPDEGPNNYYSLDSNKPQKSFTLPNKKSRYKKFRFRQSNYLNSQRKLESDDETSFIIPELPTGRYMVIDILSTWGDREYLGLNGIEIFASNGQQVGVKQIAATPALPHRNDPRVVSNLLDGVNRTQDDMHIWLTPFYAGHSIEIEFEDEAQLAMLRIWNYNKSRIHSYRGAKDVTIRLDDTFIFKGEIAQACGSILGPLNTFGDTILFTTDENILEKISQNDPTYDVLISVSGKETPDKIERPLTASADEDTRLVDDIIRLPKDGIPVDTISIIFLENWGHPTTIGLSGIEIVGEGERIIQLSNDNLVCTANMETLNALIDGENISTDPHKMWSTHLSDDIVLTIHFYKPTTITGIRIWNYNENLDMSFAGVRSIKIYVDNTPIVNPHLSDASFLLRRAPGNCNYDYVQELNFLEATTVRCEPFYNFSAEADTSFDQLSMPEGFVFQIVIYTTWGDQYYVGLNGIELFDDGGRKIVLTENNICAHPESVNVLPGVSGDIRTPDKLVDSVNDQSNGTHSWLAPVIPKCLNRIYVVFDQPMTVSVIKLWNYYKTPTRGVKEFGILVDDLLVYNGILDKANLKSSVKHRTILFTNNTDVLQKEMASLVKHSIDSQATVLMNNDLRMTTGGSVPNADQSLRPFTSVNRFNRGKTSASN